MITLVLFNAEIFADTNCECGEHSTGITAYTVNGTDCCKSTPGATAFTYTYSQQANGTWQLTGQTQITGTDAQNACCTNGL